MAARPGLMIRAGMAGQITGLDRAGSLALLPAGLDRAFAVECLDAAESGLLAGFAKSQDE